MSVCSIKSLDGKTLLVLDATEDIEYSRQVAITKNTVFSGSQISDNVNPELPVITFSGVVSYFKVRDTTPSPTKYRKEIDKLIDGKELMSFTGTADNSIPSLKNCYIQNFSVSRDSTVSNGLYVTITLMQLDISTAVSATHISAPSTAKKSDKLEGQGDSKTNGGTGTTEEKTLFAQGAYWFGSLFK